MTFKQNMSRNLNYLALLCTKLVLVCVLSFSIPVLAAGTAANTTINNTATLAYDIAGVPQTNITSPVASFVVDELIDLTLTWQDGAPVSVNSPDVNKALTFLLTNTGNGQEAFSLSRNNTLAGDNYNPNNGTAGSIFLESNGIPGLQIGVGGDTLYVPGVNDPNLAPDASQIIYVESDTPSGLGNGNTGNVQLSAASSTVGAAGAAAGTGLVGLGTGGVTAVVGTNQAQAQRIGSYIVSGLTVNVLKSRTCSPAAPLPADSCSLAKTGTLITYQLQVTLAGAGTATGLVITDPIPANLTYVPNSTTVGGSPRTDAIDADNVQFSANTVSVNLGNPSAPSAFTITFNATIN